MIAPLTAPANFVVAHQNGLFFAGDIGQRVFRSAFPWKSAGVDIQGRSRSLKVNYRTSHQIRAKSDLLLPTRLLEADGGEDKRTSVSSVFHGPSPEIHAFANLEAEADAATQWIVARTREGLEPSTIAVPVRSETEIARARDVVDRSGIDGVSISLMHDAKGADRCIGTCARDAGVDLGGRPGAHAAGLHVQKKSLIADERRRARVKRARADWCRHRMPAIRVMPELVVFIDETSVKTNLTRLRGRSLRGTRLTASAPFGNWGTQTLIAGLTQDDMIAPWVVAGAMDGPAFAAYISEVLVPLSAAIQPGPQSDRNGLLKAQGPPAPHRCTQLQQASSKHLARSANCSRQPSAGTTSAQPDTLQREVETLECAKRLAWHCPVTEVLAPTRMVLATATVAFNCVHE